MWGFKVEIVQFRLVNIQSHYILLSNKISYTIKTIICLFYVINILKMINKCG